MNMEGKEYETTGIPASNSGKSLSLWTMCRQNDSLNGAIAQQVSSLSNANQGADIAAYESQFSEAKANVMDPFCSSFRTWQSCMSLIYQTYYNAQTKCWEKAIQAESRI